jgi:hypothetical protein
MTLSTRQLRLHTERTAVTINPACVVSEQVEIATLAVGSRATYAT